MTTLPTVGMEFDSVDEAWEFWVEYGRKTGFGVRKQWLNKRKEDKSIRSCRFVCCKEGHRRVDKRSFTVKNPRAETRTGCEARISLSEKNGKFVIHEFVGDHNHCLQLAETTHMLASHRKISEVQAYEIEIAEDCGLMQKANFQLMSAHSGGRSHLGYTRLDARNYLKSRRQRCMVYGEAGSLLAYFQHQQLDNPSFYHAYQMDSDEQITNVFWADAKMILDYGYFGDVVSLDTTHCTNHANRPLALFSGFNHFRGAVIFGAALLYDETIPSFEWLFETFLEAHGNKKPQTMFTDQAAAMASALAKVMPETRHGLCTWHLMQNGIKHLGNLMKKENHFLTFFKKCLYDYDQQVDFEEAWKKSTVEFNVIENKWVKSMYDIKEKWAACYMKQAFTLGMRSTQLSESLNSDFKACMTPTINVSQFFKHFERVVEDKRYNELVCEFESRHKLAKLRYEHSPILIQLADVYTPTIFNLFSDEFSLFLAASIRERNVSQVPFSYVVIMAKKEGEWRVLFDPVNSSITCTCRKFETFGVLCCHALKVFDANDVKAIPNQYILKRWTRDARNGVIYDLNRNEVIEDPKLSSTRRYRQLCPTMIRLAAEVSNSEKLYQFVENGIHELCKQVIELRLQERSLVNDEGDDPIVTKEYVTQAKGFKKRQGLKTTRRLRPWNEVQPKRKRKPPAKKPSPCEVFEVYNLWL